MRAQLQFFDGRAYQALPLEQPLTIGGRESPIRVPGATVTRHQARVFDQAGRFWIEDLGADGVWVNGVRVERAPLKNRDKIQIGSLTLEYFEE